MRQSLGARLQRTRRRARAARMATSRRRGAHDGDRRHLGARHAMADGRRHAHARRELRRRLGVVRARERATPLRDRDDRPAVDDRARTHAARRGLPDGTRAYEGGGRSRARRIPHRGALGVRRLTLLGRPGEWGQGPADRRCCVIRRPALVVRRQKGAGLGLAGVCRGTHGSRRFPARVCCARPIRGPRARHVRPPATAISPPVPRRGRRARRRLLGRSLRMPRNRNPKRSTSQR